MDSTIKDFEAAITELETIVKKLEEGDLPLETSLQLYERGVQLSRFCHAQLEQAERRIEILNERGGLTPAPANLGAEDESEGPYAAMSAADNLQQYLTARRTAIDAALLAALPSPPSCPSAVADAMRFSVCAGGKRLRPILCLASAEAVGGDWRQALPGGLCDRVHSHVFVNPRRSARHG
jgi:exodeoxyribonuclease VII small subunit